MRDLNVRDRIGLTLDHISANAWIIVVAVPRPARIVTAKDDSYSMETANENRRASTIEAMCRLQASQPSNASVAN